MQPIDEFCSQLTSLFARGGNTAQITESLHRRQVDLTDCDLRTPDFDEITAAFSQLPQRDTVTLTVRPRHAAPVLIASVSDTAAIQHAIEELDDTLQLADSRSGELSLTIEKSVSERTISVYSLFDLGNNWTDMALSELLQGFSRAITEENVSLFSLINDDYAFATRTAVFSGETTYVSPHELSFDRTELLSSHLTVCNFSNASSIRLLPDDFFICSGSPPENIRNLFDKLCITLVFVFLCDTSTVRNPSNLSVSLRGYILIQKNIEFDKITTDNLPELFRVYEWCYSDGCLVDRVGLARNVLSLHTTEAMFPSFNEGVLPSIHSSFEIYLKENVDQYINIKSKLDEHLNSLAHDVASVSKDIASSFKTNVWMLVSFLASAVALKILRGSGNSPLITTEILVVFGLFAAFSLAYLIVVHIDAVRDVDRLNTRYSNIKRRYSDILAKVDIERIFNEDTDINSEKEHIRKTKRRYFTLWISFLTIFTTLVLVLWLNTPSSPTSPSTPSRIDDRGVTNSQGDENPEDAAREE